MSTPKNSLLNLKNYFAFETVVVLLCAFLVFPFFILTCYDYPSIDDYSFLYSSNTFGIWKSQVNWYTLWTGRYSSTFIISLHPLLINSFALYKILAALAIVLTMHASYVFIKFVLPSVNRITTLLLVVVTSFCFLSGMPSIVQGIYWVPGAITYQLANVLTIYLAVHILSHFEENKSLTPYKKAKPFILIFIICGLNETSMIALDILLCILFLYFLVSTKRVRKDLLFYILFAVVCSLIVLLAPGNSKRDLTFISEQKHQVLFTITSSFTASYDFIKVWIANSDTLLCSLVLFLSAFLIPSTKSISIKNETIKLLFLSVSCYVLIAACFATGFWSIGSVFPPRTINVNFWVFLFLWFSIVFVFASLVKHFFKSAFVIRIIPITTFVLTLFLILGNHSNNYSLAVTDLISGNAYTYGNECMKRDKIMRETPGLAASIPSFTVIPKSIFNEDLPPSGNSWWSFVYAQYYGKSYVRVVSERKTSNNSLLFNFESEQNKLLKNLESITNDVSYSFPSACVLPSKNTYSPVYSVECGTFFKEHMASINKVLLSVSVYSTDSVVDAAVVFSISRPNSESTVLWKSKEIVMKNYTPKQWKKEEAEIVLDHAPFAPTDIVSIYVWNRGSSKIYVDDLQINTSE